MKAARSSPDEADFFKLLNTFSHIMVLGSTQRLGEMSTRNLPGVKGDQRIGLTTLSPSVDRLSKQNMGASTSHKPMGLYGLLQG
jgi:hypothetical protein